MLLYKCTGDDLVIVRKDKCKNVMRNELLKRISKKMVANPDDYMSSFRKNLLTYVEQKEISLADIANEADISVETLKTLLYGKATDCKLSTAVSLAKALQLSVDELVGCGTISPQMCESIQTVRNLPSNYVSFFRWSIKYHEQTLREHKASVKAINIMWPECMANGNLQMTNNFELMDISDLADEIRYKIFMGVRIPCEHYMPVFSEGEILLLANDRMPLQNEMVVVVNNGFLRIVKRKEIRDENNQKRIAFYTVRKGDFMAYEEELDYLIGYVVKRVTA